MIHFDVQMLSLNVFFYVNSKFAHVFSRISISICVVWFCCASFLFMLVVDFLVSNYSEEYIDLDF